MTPDGQSFPLPQVQVRRRPETYRFLPDAKGLVVLQGPSRGQNFYLLDFETGKLRQLTDLRPGGAILGFDVPPDGQEIVFDRVGESSDIVLIELASR